MAQVVTSSAAPQRKPRVKFTWWDQIMRLADAGIVAWALVIYVFLYMPIAVLIAFSFNAQKLNVTWTGFTFHWYNVLFHDQNIIAIAFRPWIVGTLIGAGILVVGVLLIWQFSKPRWYEWVRGSSGKNAIRWALVIAGWVAIVAGILQMVAAFYHNVKGAFASSMEIAILSTFLAVVIGTLGSFSLVRFEYRTKSVWDGLNYTKIIIAEVVAGVSTLLFFVQMREWILSATGFDLWFFNLGFWTVLIAHVAWNIPFVVVIIRARLAGFDKQLEEAGSDLGATPVGVFFRVTLPVIAPGILAASLLSFTLSFDDFVTTFFVAGTNITTLPLVIWSMVRMVITPEINAISTFMMAFSMTIVAVLEIKVHISEDIA